MKVTVINKKTLTIIGLVAMLVVAAIINIQMSGKKKVATNEADSPDAQVENVEEQEEATAHSSAVQVLSNYETERRTTRLEELKYLDEIIANETVDEASRSVASQQRIKVMKNIQVEQVISEILIAKGFERVTVVCGTNSVNILVEGNTLDDAKVAQILDVVLTETETTSENVKIIPLD